MSKQRYLGGSSLYSIQQSALEIMFFFPITRCLFIPCQVVTDNGKLEKMRVVHKDHPTAQEAITDYEVLGPSVLGKYQLLTLPVGF